MYTYWKEQGILENILRTLRVFWHMSGVTLVRGASFCSHVKRTERLASLRSGQGPRVLRVQHRSEYDQDAVWRHGRLQSHGVHSFWDAVAAVKLPRCEPGTILRGRTHKSYN